MTNNQAGIYMSIRTLYERKMQARLNELKIEIAELKEKVGQAEANLELEYYTLIEELHLKLEATEQKFHLLKEAQDEKWQEFKAEFELSWDSLLEMIKAITSP
jgi:hypothetical protein